jgi:hypothetical protein
MAPAMMNTPNRYAMTAWPRTVARVRRSRSVHPAGGALRPTGSRRAQHTEIGAELFLSRTVEWHLRKVFAKLGITSRKGLQGSLVNTQPVQIG